MPLAPPTRCPNCRRLQRAVGLCSDCRTARYGARKAIYNSPAWLALRDRVLSEEPVCRRCRAPAPTDVDHIIGLDKAPHLALTRSNVQALCAPCHGRKTRAEG